MFWWQKPDERMFAATSGITIAVVEIGDRAYYRVAPRRDVRQPPRCDSDLLPAEEAAGYIARGGR